MILYMADTRNMCVCSTADQPSTESRYFFILRFSLTWLHNIFLMPVVLMHCPFGDPGHTLREKKNTDLYCSDFSTTIILHNLCWQKNVNKPFDIAWARILEYWYFFSRKVRPGSTRKGQCMVGYIYDISCSLYLW